MGGSNRTLRETAVAADDLLACVTSELEEALGSVHDGVVGEGGVRYCEVLLGLCVRVCVRVCTRVCVCVQVCMSVSRSKSTCVCVRVCASVYECEQEREQERVQGYARGGLSWV